MSEIDALQSRLSAAIDRIGRAMSGMEQASPPAAAPEQEAPAATAAPEAAQLSEELQALQTELSEERLANAQLEERLKAVKARHSAEIGELRAALDEARAAAAAVAEPAPRDDATAEEMARLDTELQRLRQANEQLRASNVALREANAEGVGEPHLINKAMLAELESLRAVRAADVAEANGILARLRPVLDAAAERLPADTAEEEEA